MKMDRAALVALGLGLAGCGSRPMVASSAAAESAAMAEPPRDPGFVDLGTIRPSREKPTETPSEKPATTAATKPAPGGQAAHGTTSPTTPDGAKQQGVVKLFPPSGAVVGGENKPAPKPRAAETTSASGQLSAADVDAAISSQYDGFAACSSSESVVSIRASVSPEGRVLDVTAGRSTPDDARLRECVAAAFRAIQFPQTSASYPSRLAFDLRLAPE